IRQIRKNKTKLEKKLHEASFDDILTSAEDEETNFEIIRIKSIFLRPQSIDEAVLQMNMLGHQFYMFRNATTDLVSVVYKRADGGYGVIEPND
ncbi:MAG: sigma 54 modulation/S30EA ribosomal C-terminal domain-containing protein, partial [Oscillospiraceae bacterium]